MNTKVLLRRIMLSIVLALLDLFLILWQVEKSRIDTIKASMDTRISVVFASLCSDLSQDLGRYETDDWQRLHAYTFYLTNIDMVSFGAVPEEAEAREKLVFALGRSVRTLRRKAHRISRRSPREIALSVFPFPGCPVDGGDPGRVGGTSRHMMQSVPLPSDLIRW